MSLITGRSHRPSIPRTLSLSLPSLCSLGILGRGQKLHSPRNYSTINQPGTPGSPSLFIHQLVKKAFLIEVKSNQARNLLGPSVGRNFYRRVINNCCGALTSSERARFHMSNLIVSASASRGHSDTYGVDFINPVEKETRLGGTKKTVYDK